MRLIDADALLYDLEIVPLTEDGGVDINDLEDIVKRQPTIEDRKTGRWRPVQIGSWHGFECTACKINREVPCWDSGKPQWKYCPECGARMEE